MDDEDLGCLREPERRDSARFEWALGLLPDVEEPISD